MNPIAGVAERFAVEYLYVFRDLKRDAIAIVVSGDAIADGYIAGAEDRLAICGDTVLCAIHPPEAIRKILDCLGLPSRPPPIASAELEGDVDELQIS